MVLLQGLSQGPLLTNTPCSAVKCLKPKEKMKKSKEDCSTFSVPSLLASVVNWINVNALRPEEGLI